MIYDQEMLIPLFFFCLCVCVWETEREGGKEREWDPYPHTGFLLFLFPFVWHLSQLLWDQMVFTSHTRSLSFSVAHSQEKSHLCPIKTSLSPTKLIVCVSVCVQVISRGWTEFRFAAQQKKKEVLKQQIAFWILTFERRVIWYAETIGKSKHGHVRGCFFFYLPKIVWRMVYFGSKLSRLLRKGPPAQYAPVL